MILLSVRMILGVRVSCIMAKSGSGKEKERKKQRCDRTLMRTALGILCR